MLDAVPGHRASQLAFLNPLSFISADQRKKFISSQSSRCAGSTNNVVGSGGAAGAVTPVLIYSNNDGLFLLDLATRRTVCFSSLNITGLDVLNSSASSSDIWSAGPETQMKKAFLYRDPGSTTSALIGVTLTSGAVHVLDGSCDTQIIANPSMRSAAQLFRTSMLDIAADRCPNLSASKTASTASSSSASPITVAAVNYEPKRTKRKRKFLVDEQVNDFLQFSKIVFALYLLFFFRPLLVSTLHFCYTFTGRGKRSS